MKLRKSFLTFLLLAAAATAAHAQDDENDNYGSQARGVSADSAYQISDLDTVNLFNGNLNIALPIGHRFSADGTLDWGLDLVYNSTAWSSERETCHEEIEGTQPDPEYRLFNYSLPVPNPLANVGIGWELSLGRLLEPTDDIHHPTALRPARWTYVSPDGARHGFDDKLRGVPALDDERYSSDGSYLRMRVVETGEAGCHNLPDHEDISSCRIVDTPDGHQHIFADFDPLTAGDEPNWRLTQIRDPFDNTLDIHYTTHQWDITDGYRTVSVRFRPSADPDEDPEDYRFKSVEWVKVPQASGGRVQYDFVYSSSPMVTRHGWDAIWNHCAVWNPDHPLIPSSPFPGSAVAVDFLTEIRFPDGSFHQMVYDTTDGGDRKSGALRRMRLRTGVWYHWDYGLYEFFYERPASLEIGLFDANAVAGVVRKERFPDMDGNGASLGAWTYFPKAHRFEEPVQDGNGPCFHTNTVMDPLGNETVHYFNTAERSHRTTHGLPFTRCDPDPMVMDFELLNSTCPENLIPRGCGFVSRQVYEGSGTDRVLLREHYVRYDDDGTGNPGFERNNRIVYEATGYFDDNQTTSIEAPIFTEVKRSDFDGFGNFRVIEIDGNAPDGDNDAKVVTNYLPAGNGSTLPALSSRWLFGTYDQVVTTEDLGTHQATEQFCFDDRGFLLGRRKVTNPTSNDLLVQYDEVGGAGTGNGNLAAERYYGGDGAGLAAGCSGDFGTADYRKVHGYTSGMRDYTAWVADDNDTPVLVPLDLGIHGPSGLPTSSFDVSGIRTTFTYDEVGRLIEEKPADGAWTRHTFDYPKVGDPSPDVTYTVERCRKGTTDCSLARDHHVYDVLGRVVRSERSVPLDGGGTTAARTFAYNALGWPTETGVWGLSSKTRYQDYDRFGRAGTIVAPDGTTSTVDYQGDRETTSTVKVQGPTGLVDRVVMQSRDSKGRLVRLVEPAGVNGAPVVTRYDYDEGNRIVQVCVDEAQSGACGQSRTFTYDDRGLLTSESRPESTKSDYTYDALGNVTSRRQGTDPNLQFGLDYDYDQAGRMTQVWGYDGPSTPRLLRELFYARGGENGTKGAGKLAVAKHHNYVPDPFDPGNERDVVVTERFAYQAQDGRLSSRTQRASNGVSFTLAVQAYDPLGNPSTLRYPACDAGTGCESLFTRTVTASYQNGYLTGLPGYATSIRYHGNGQIAKVVHANSVSDIYDRGSDGRLQSIRTEGVTGGNWQSGVFGYDPAGNIETIGSEQFRYDRANRLVSATIDLDPGTGTELRSRTYGFDTFGNLASIDGDGDPIGGIAYSTVNNRLTTGAVYDVAGNVTRLQPGDGTYDYQHDALDRITSLSGPGGGRAYLYTASGERLATVDLADGTETWTPRGLDNQVLRRLVRSPTDWTVDRDYVYAGTRLVATLSPGAPDEIVRHTSLDHLGSTRLITDGDANHVAFQTYYPFGQNAGDPGPGAEPVQFTGHERDDNGPGLAGDLDYMHARYYTARYGRFLSIDPARSSADVGAGQSWNRYAYALNNPIRLVDPDGEIAITATVAIVGLAALTVLVVNHTIQMQANPAYQQSVQDLATRLAEGAESTVSGIEGLVASASEALTPEEAATISAPIVAVGPANRPVQPGRVGPAPAPYPGARPRTTPVPDLPLADQDDPKQPPVGDELGERIQDQDKKGFLGKLSDVIGKIGELLDG